MNFHLRPTLMVIISLLVACTMLLALLFIDAQVRESVETQTERNFSLATSAAALQIGNHIDNATRTIRELRNLVAQGQLLVESTHSESMGRALGERLRELPGIERLGFVSAKSEAGAVVAVRQSTGSINYEYNLGQVIQMRHVHADGRLSNSGERHGDLIGKGNWWKESMFTDAVMLTGPHLLPDGREGFTLALRVSKPASQLMGVFFADFHRDELAQGLANLVGSHGEDAVLMDFRGNIIASAGTIRAPNYSAAAQQAFKDNFKDVRALGLYRGLTRDTNLGESPFRVTFRRIVLSSGVDWTLAALLPSDTLYAPVAKVRRSILLFAALAFMLGMIGASILSARIAHPLRQLEEEAARIRDFQLDGNITVRSRIQEISSLANAMQGMKAGLRQFSIYVPRALVRQFVSEGLAARLGGERRELTLIFTDLVGFTRLTENLQPEEVMHRLSDYFRDMSSAILANGGTIDKYIGDAIMAFWNAPLDDDQHALHACRAALAMHTVNERINETLQAAGFATVFTRIGIHSGEVIVGNVGSEDRMQYTALGSTVNLASRLEGLNKKYGTDRLVSETVFAQVADHFWFRLVANVQPVGTSRPIKVYELLEERNSDRSEALARLCREWETAMTAWQNGDFAKAATLFKNLANSNPDDKLAALYSSRAEDLCQSAPANWDAIDRLDEK